MINSLTRISGNTEELSLGSFEPSHPARLAALVGNVTSRNYGRRVASRDENGRLARDVAGQAALLSCWGVWRQFSDMDVGRQQTERLLLSPTGSFRAYTFWTLSEALSRLYQRRFLRPRPHFSAFFKLFSSSTFFPLHHSRFLWFFKPSHHFSANFRNFLRIFEKDSRFLKFSSNFNRFFREFRRIFASLQQIMPRVLDFREIWSDLLKVCRKFAAKFLKISYYVWKKCML